MIFSATVEFVYLRIWFNLSIMATQEITSQALKCVIICKPPWVQGSY